MKVFSILIISLLLFITLSWYGCSDDKNPLPSKSHPESWSQVGTENFHGTKVLTVGYSSCTACHGENLDGGESKVSCFKCHISYPHEETWIRKDDSDFHGKYLKNLNWVLQNCRECHGQDYKGGSSEVSCFKCHASYPHSEGWLNSASENYHGSYVKQNEDIITACEKCHGVDETGGRTGISCEKCHASYPHDENWMNESSENFHGKLLQALNWSTSSCQGCHGTDLKGGSSEVSCYTCHENYPHASEWITGDNSHGKYLQDNDYSLESCQLCHGSDNSGGTSEVSCFKCHTSYPHNDNWSVSSSADYHGAFLNGLSYDLTGCQLCHGTDLLGGSSEVSCYTCHENYPHVTDWMNQNSDKFHGEYVEEDDYSSESCQNCHGTDYKGGTSNVSCYTCHNGYPHKPDFYGNKGNEEFHGNYIRQANWSMDNCKACHGVDYSGGSSGEACNKCHFEEEGPEACNVCHGFGKNSAPPEDLNNHTETSFIGVGAHRLHVDKFKSCEYCHDVYDSFDDPRHIDDTPHAEVKEAWKWNRETATCETICHTDESKTYIWTNF